MRTNYRSPRGKIPLKEYTKHSIIRRTAQCLQGVEGTLLEMADEPTGNLDTIAGRDVMALLRMMSKKYGQTVVMITHNEELAQMADQIIRLEDGKIVGEHHAGE